MSKGLGKLQAQILEMLAEKKEPRTVSGLAYDIHQLDETVDYYAKPPRSLEVSVRRAVHSLEKRGLVLANEAHQSLLDEPCRQLICWLPDQPPKDFRPQILLSGKFVERVILQVLQGTAQITDKIELNMLGRSWGDVTPFDPYKEPVRYEWLTNQVLKRLPSGRYGQGRERTAITRAVQKLAKQGLIKAYWKRVGIYGSVMLVKQEKISVAL